MRRLLALLAPTPHGWGVELAREIVLQGSVAEYAIRICPFPSNPEHIPHCDAVLAQIFTQDQAVALERLSVPVVNLDGGLERLPFPRVGIDQLAIGRLVADYFMSAGVTATAFIGISSRHNSRAMAQAFSERLAEAGIPCHMGMSAGTWRNGLPGSPSDRREDDRLRALLLRLPPGAGILAWGPALALAVYDLCAGERAFPHDLRLVAGSDDLQLTVAHPAISAVRQSAVAVVAKALARLERRQVGARRHDVELIAPTDIVVRGSSDVGQVRDPAVARALDAIRAGYGRRLDVAEVAMTAGLSRRTLERRFRTVTGHSILAELARLRLLHAGELLACGLPVADIARRCGYAGTSQFSRLFRQRHGVAPTAWRDRG